MYLYLQNEQTFHNFYSVAYPYTSEIVVDARFSNEAFNEFVYASNDVR